MPVSRSSWNTVRDPGRAPAGVRSIPVHGARTVAEAVARARSMPWWGRAIGKPFLSRGQFHFRVAG